MKIEFNTHRHYSSNGQRIEAVLHEGSIYFNDLDRGISGKLRGTFTSLTKELVMMRYDKGMYEDCSWRNY